MAEPYPHAELSLTHAARELRALAAHPPEGAPDAGPPPLPAAAAAAAAAGAARPPAPEPAKKVRSDLFADIDAPDDGASALSTEDLGEP
ncbi:MAG: hypothetical protein IT384_00775 [Deltaproteobacteria bacterium]|nr:hypothetical protein [Deltaproteobacteria bacterium]